MPHPRRLPRCAWLVVLLLAAVFVAAGALARLRQVRQVTEFAEWSVDPPAPDAHSPTGYADGWRRLILPEHDNDGYRWIAETQQMLARGEWRLRHVDDDNAPAGRAVTSPSAYRWWLAGAAWLEHAFTGRPTALGVEDAALWSGPLLQLLLLGTLGWFVARSFGTLPATVALFGCVGFFPLSASFGAGAPDATALGLLCAAWSLVPIVAGIRELEPGGAQDRASSARRARRYFGVAGVAGGLGLWVDPGYQWPLLVGLAGGALFAALLRRSSAHAIAPPAPWLWWALCGCLTSLAAYAAENFPDNLELRFDANHPAFAFSWLGLGGLLAIATRRLGAESCPEKSRWYGAAGSIALVLVAPLALMATGAKGWLPEGPASTRLAGLATGILAPDFPAWVARDGFGAPVWLVCFPLALAILGIGIAASSRFGPGLRAGTAVALGPVAATMFVAWHRLHAWNFLDVATVALAVAITAVGWDLGRRRGAQWLGAAVALLAAAGLFRPWPKAFAGDASTFSEIEVEGIIERDLAHWLAQRTGRAGAVVFAPPNLTTALQFHAGLRGIGTLDPDNHDGFAAAVRMASATSRDEALALLQEHEVAYVVLPSWDSFLQEYAQLGLKAAPGSERFEKSFVAGLARWDLPRWLRPLPYRLPSQGGFAGKTAAVFELVPEQDAPTAAARLVDYFIETGRSDRAGSLRAELERYPANVGARVALAQIEIAAGHTAAFHRAVETLRPLLAARTERRLPWDRRLALAVVLAQAKQLELARSQMQRCVAELDEAKLRSLGAASLVRLFAAGRLTGTGIGDTRLKALALSLLPPDLRAEVR